MQNFTNKTAVITGGATGIGFALAKALGLKGARIVIGEPVQQRLDTALTKLRELGITAKACVCDVRSPDSVDDLAEFACNTYGNVDILINNAGIGGKLSPAADLPLEIMKDVFDVNFHGVWHGCRSFAPRMVAQGTPAAIYNVGSENSFFAAAPNMAAYVASKHAVLGFTDAFREEMPDFIKVGLIIPGYVKSELTTSGGRGQNAMDADEYAQIVLKQIQQGAEYIVSHAYNIERIRPRFDTLEKAYNEYAPRYDGDDEHDIRTLLAKARRK